MKYIKPKMWTIVFETEDVIRTSGPLEEDKDENPDLKEDEGFGFA